MYMIEINGEESNYKSEDKQALEQELDDLITHSDNKEWIKGKEFEIVEV